MKRKGILLFLLILLPVMVIKVDAKVFTIDEVSENLNKENFATKVNTEGKTLDFYSDDDVLFSFKYSDDYILYDDPVSEVTEDNLGMAAASTLYFSEIMKSIIAMSGVTVDTFKDEITSCTDYDTYGLAIKELEYNFSDNSEGSSVSIGGKYINYLKLSLDSEKLVRLANTYGNVVDYSKYKDLIASSFVKINTFWDKKQVDYKFTLDYTKKDENDNPKCFMYRSDSLNGTYTKVQMMQSSCIDSNDGSYLFDDDVTDGKVYYYKAQVVGSDKFGDIIKVDLANNTVTDAISGEPIVDKIQSKDDDTDNDTSNDDKVAADDKTEEKTKKDYKNPETGAFLSMIPILVLSLISIVVWSKVKNKFVRI